MKYVGSKNRFKKELIPIIQEMIDENAVTTYYEPFVGGCNVIDKIQCETRIGNDSHEYLIAMFKELQSGWIPPETITEDEYNAVKLNMSDYPDYYVGLVGFAATFGSKWFGGYARGFKEDKITRRDHPNEGIRNIMTQINNIKGVELLCGDYKNILTSMPIGWVIYCDPPYENTTPYKNTIDHNEFWKWCVEMSENNIVLVSEYSAPDGWEVLWEKETTTTLKVDKHEPRVEKLFIYHRD